MKTKLFTMIAAVGALASLATGCDKPDNTPSCLIGRGLWVASYKLVDDNGSADCKDKPGDLLNLNKYQAFPTPSDPSPASSVAIKPYTLRYSALPAAQRPGPEVAGTDRTDLALGTFASNFASNSTCTIQTLTTASATPHGVRCAKTSSNPASSCFGVPAGDPSIANGQADLDVIDVPVSYAFSNVTFLDDTTHGGQQMKADLEFKQGACTQHYSVTALYGLDFLTGGPATCLSQIDCDPHINDDPNRLDLQLAIPAFATGINPDYPVFCDVTLGDYLGVAQIFLSPQLAGFPIGVCNLDGDYGTTCDHNANPDCWKSGPQAQAAAANP